VGSGLPAARVFGEQALLWVNFLLVALAAVLLVPVGVLCAECLAALLPARQPRRRTARHHDLEHSRRAARLAVLIPAHNEEAVLGATLLTLAPQLRDGDRLIVVADNCDDHTAQIARSFGATVLERTDSFNRGKGFALDHGIGYLKFDPPDVVIMVDADCTIHDGAIDALVNQVAATGRPAQACYLMERPEKPAAKDCVSALAFLVKNWVRPSGLSRLGLPCLLTGTGMAFPWPVIANATLASGNIVEDMQLGLDLALAGHAPLFCDGAHVTGHLPKIGKIAYGQRTRWEHGHLQTLLTQVPGMFKAALKHRRPQALALAMEVSVPPLCLLTMLLIGAIAVTTAAAFIGTTWLATELLAAGMASIALCLSAAWLKFGRRSLPLTALLATPIYMAWKVPMYLAFLFKRHTEWNRTARAAAASPIAGPLVPAPAAPPVPALAAALATPLAPAFSALRAFELPPAGMQANHDFNLDLPHHAAAPTGPAALPILPGAPNVVTAAQCVHLIFRWLQAGRGGMVVRPTLDYLNWCARDREFAQLVASAELVVSDPLPPPWSSRAHSTSAANGGALPPGRVAGADLCWNLIAAAAKAARTLYLLGDDVEITGEAAAAVQERFPRLRLAGTYDAPNGFDSEHEAFQHVANAVSRAKPDIVLVALGTPKQERLIVKLRNRLPQTWWLAVGNSFQFLCDDTRSLPLWARDAHRGDREPADLADGDGSDSVIPFAASLLGGAAAKRLARILGKSAPQEKALREALEGGIDNLSVADHDTAAAPPTAPPSPKRDPSSAAAAAARAIVYQSFLSGFFSEFNDDNGRGGDGLLRRASFVTHPPLLRLRAIVLLGGAVRPSRLSAALGRSPLDLPLEDGRSILYHWRQQAVELRRLAGLEELPVRVLVDHNSLPPIAPARGTHVRVFVERDASPYRGTAGVLRDVADRYADDDYLLVANGAQALLVPLPDLAATLAEPAAAVTLITHEEGTPSGLMLVRCAALRAIAKTGYVDMKEQALPLMASRFDVRHLPHACPTGLPVRTLGEYVTAIQQRYRRRLGRPLPTDPFAEDCRPSFAVIEDGASVHPAARVHDSVILQGAHVGQDALVVRSVVGPGSLLVRGEHIVDQLVATDAATRPAIPSPQRLAGTRETPKLAMR
jgi:exopolysaccharide biosynthesis WecB/TagA/CpsF family protein